VLTAAEQQFWGEMMPSAFPVMKLRIIHAGAIVRVAHLSGPIELRAPALISNIHKVRGRGAQSGMFYDPTIGLKYCIQPRLCVKKKYDPGVSSPIRPGRICHFRLGLYVVTCVQTAS
jgi:hypothetical protein